MELLHIPNPGIQSNDLVEEGGAAIRLKDEGGSIASAPIREGHGDTNRFGVRKGIDFGPTRETIRDDESVAIAVHCDGQWTNEIECHAIEEERDWRSVKRCTGWSKMRGLHFLTSLTGGQEVFDVAVASRPPEAVEELPVDFCEAKMSTGEGRRMKV
jgi:hypothetical protein